MLINEVIKYFYVMYSYEPELHPGVTYKLKEPKATLKIFSTGSVTVTGWYYLFCYYREIVYFCVIHCFIIKIFNLRVKLYQIYRNYTNFFYRIEINQYF